MGFVVLYEDVNGWSSGFTVESDETPAVLLARLGREGVVMDRPFDAQYLRAGAKLKTLRINKGRTAMTFEDAVWIGLGLKVEGKEVTVPRRARAMPGSCQRPITSRPTHNVNKINK